MPKTIPALAALALGGACLLASPAYADDTDRALLATFCDAANIKGSTCTRARNYPDAGERGCDVAMRRENVDTHSLVVPALSRDP